jgi:hypothetical protein
MRVLPCLLLLLPIGGPLAQTTFAQRLEQLMEGRCSGAVHVPKTNPGIYYLTILNGHIVDRRRILSL